MLVTPKERFQQGADGKANIEAFRSLLEKGIFQKAADQAMLEYHRLVHTNAEPNPNGALAGYYRLLGAQEFLQTLIKLADPHITVANVQRESLNHRA